MRFDSCDRENRTISLKELEPFKKIKKFHVAKDLPFPQLDGIAPGDYVNVQFEVMEWREERIAIIEKCPPDMASASA